MILAFTAGVVRAQDKKEDFKALVESKQLVFKAQTALSSRMGTRQLTTEYDLQVRGDSLISHLPYFGRAFTASYNTNESPLIFNLTSFDYKVKNRRKGGWDITIIPKESRDVRQLFLSVSSNGYGTLIVTSTNREPISFNGYITGKR